MSWVSSGRGAPDHFDWFSQVMQERGLVRPTQWTLFVVACLSSMVPLTVLFTNRSLTAGVVLVNACIAIYIFGISLVWLIRWPTRLQSAVSALAGSACIAGWSATQPHAASAALACCAMAFIGGYLALFHSRMIVSLHLVAVAGVAVLAAVRLDRETDIVTAIAAFWLMWFLNLSSVLALRLMSRALRTYAIRADEDALTSLLNRRGFIAALTRRLAEPAVEGTCLTLLMIDIDAFKRINDTYGHAEGDRALIAVADLLREHVDSSAVLCRAGGEEFLVAVLGTSAHADVVSERVGAAIAELPQGVTASIGSTTCEIQPMDPDDIPEFIQQQICAADTAMYTAKRLGGNRSHRV